MRSAETKAARLDGVAPPTPGPGRCIDTVLIDLLPPLDAALAGAPAYVPIVLL